MFGFCFVLLLLLLLIGQWLLFIKIGRMLHSHEEYENVSAHSQWIGLKGPCFRMSSSVSRVPVWGAGCLAVSLCRTEKSAMQGKLHQPTHGVPRAEQLFLNCQSERSVTDGCDSHTEWWYFSITSPNWDKHGQELEVLEINSSYIL